MQADIKVCDEMKQEKQCGHKNVALYKEALYKVHTKNW